MSSNFFIHADQPSKDDYLNYQTYINAFYDIVTNPDTETPVTLGIYGRWGSGKTTILKQLEEKLQSNNITTIWFNAWQYNVEDHLWAAFLQSILNRLYTELNVYNRLVFTLKLFIRRIKWNLWPTFSLHLIFKLLLAALPVIIIEIFPISSIKDSIVKEIISAGGISAAVAIFYVKVIRPYYQKVNDGVVLNLSAYLKSDSYQEKISFLDNFSEHYL